MTQLDDRGRAAASALLAQVDAPAGAEWEPRNPRRRQVAFAFAAFALVVGVVAAVAVARHADQKTSVAAGSGDVPRLIARTPPTGWSAAGAVDLPLPAQAPQDGTFEAALYAAPDDIDVTGPSIGVVVFRSSSASTDSSNESGESIDINGHAGTVSTQGGQPTVTWDEAPDVHVTVVGHDLDNDTLVAAARSVTINGTDAEIVSPPNGFTSRAHVHDLAVPGGLVFFVPKDATGHVAGYKSGANSSVEIMTVGGDPSLLLVDRWLLAPGARPYQVRGHRGWISQPSPTATIVWQESPDVVGVATGSAVDLVALQQFVTGLEPATDAEWNALLARTSVGRTASGSASASVSVSSFDSVSSMSSPPAAPAGALGTTFGTVGDATYTVYVDSAGALGLTIARASGTSSGVVGDSTSANQTDVGLVGVGQQALVYGKVLDNRVSQVRLELPENEVQGSVQPVAGQSVRLFAYVFDVSQSGGLTPNTTGTVVFLDASGTEVSRVPVTASVHN